MKAVEIFSFFPLINSSLIIGLGLLLLAAIIPSKTINTLHFLFRLFFSIFYRYRAYYLNIQ